MTEIPSAYSFPGTTFEKGRATNVKDINTKGNSFSKKLYAKTTWIQAASILAVLQYWSGDSYKPGFQFATL